MTITQHRHEILAEPCDKMPLELIVRKREMSELSSFQFRAEGIMGAPIVVKGLYDGRYCLVQQAMTVDRYNSLMPLQIAEMLYFYEDVERQWVAIHGYSVKDYWAEKYYPRFVEGGGTMYADFTYIMHKWED